MATDNAEPDYQSQDDARTLKAHAEVTSDPERHAAALAHMQKEQATNQTAIDSAHKQLRGKVKKGLKKAFPKSGDAGDSPFQKAGKEGVPPPKEEY